MRSLFSVLINVPNIRVYPTDNLRLLGLTRNPFVKPNWRNRCQASSVNKDDDNYDDDDDDVSSGYCCLPFCCSSCHNNNKQRQGKQQTTSGNEKAHAEGRKQMEEERWTKYTYQNRSRNEPAGSESTLESMMSSSAVVAAVRSVGSTSILASQAATAATSRTWERERTATNWHWKGCRTKQNTMVIYTPNGARIPRKLEYKCEKIKYTVGTEFG